MWTCQKCGESVEDQFESCRRCRTLRADAPEEGGTTSAQAPAKNAAATVKWRANFRMFRGTVATWEELFGEAANFASEIGPERLINISHSSDRKDGVVAVWFWAEDNGARSAEDSLRLPS